MSRPFIFLSYAREDKPQVDRVYLQLKEAGLNPWMDKPPAPHELDGVPIAAFWEPYIRDKLREAFRVLVFLSNTSVLKKGFVQKEYRLALSHLAERPQHQFWLIPVLLDDCHPPSIQVDTVSFDQLQWYELHKEGMPRLIDYLKASIPEGDEITAEHLALIHSCWRAPEHDARFPPNQVFRFEVVLTAIDAILDRIDRVTYLLPPAWPTSPVTMSDRRTSFGLKELAWADLLVRARVYVKGQKEPLYLSSFVRLTESGRRLVPKCVELVNARPCQRWHAEMRRFSHSSRSAIDSFASAASATFSHPRPWHMVPAPRPTPK